MSASSPKGVYRFTSIARPVDPRYPTNLAVLVLMPLAGLLGAIVRHYRDGSEQLSFAVTSMLVAFVAWAVTRELAPDDDRAAFVAMALALAALFFVGAGSVLILFVALLLIRIVNRSTGLPARLFDSASVAGLTIWAAFALGQPLLSLVGAVAFAADAVLEGGRRWQLGPAAACLAAFAVISMTEPFPVAANLAAGEWAFVAVVAAAYVLATLGIRHVRSVGDVGGAPLSPTRVRIGMAIGLLVAAQSLVADGGAALSDSPLWACLAAVPLSAGVAALLGRRTPSPHR